MKLPRDSRDWPWLAIVIGLAFLPFVRGLSLSSIFHVRDLSMFFWPRHVWIRNALLHGHFPWWDPYSAGGQPTFPDALNQFFLPPVMLLRLLPAVLGFNLIVALPFPLAALGAWMLLRRRFPEAASALGAVAFAASGAVLSTGNFPNLSWSVAWIPWALWAAERDRDKGTRASFVLLSAMLALQMLSGEPVTMAGTLALVGGYLLFIAEPTVQPNVEADKGHASASRANAVRALARFGGAVAMATAVAAVQLVPMALAARHSPRAFPSDTNFWSLHPLWLLESVLPHVFGDTFTAYLRQLPWIPPLNSDREPFFFSLYLGPVVLLVAMLGALAGDRRWRGFWVTVFAAGLTCGLGSYTPIYPFLQRVIPVLDTLRFPAKFFVFASLGVAFLAANGLAVLNARPFTGGNESDSVAQRALRATIATGIVLTTALVVVVGAISFAPAATAQLFFRVGIATGVTDPVAGAQFLLRGVPTVAARTIALLLIGTLLIVRSWRSPQAGLARALLLALAAGDLVLAHMTLNPVLTASELSAPSWAGDLQGHDRFYTGGKFGGSVVGGDPDLALVQVRAAEGLTAAEAQSSLAAFTVLTPSAWRVREFFSYDLPLLWPAEQDTLTTLFERSDRAGRLRILERAGVRYCFMGDPPRPGQQPLRLYGSRLAAMPLFECSPHARRTYVVSAADVVPDRRTALSRFMDPAFAADSAVLVEGAVPPVAGTAGAPAAPTARLIRDDEMAVTIEAAAEADGGFLVLLDSFDEGWSAKVDGTPAPILRANLLFRSVHLAPGPHLVEFTYRPMRLYVSMGISLIAVAGLIALAAIPRRATGFRAPGSRTA